MRKISLIIALLCCLTLCFSGLAANPMPLTSLGLNQLKQSESVPNTPATKQLAGNITPQATLQPENFTILKQDSGINLSQMNLTLTLSPTYGSAQTVKFTAPKPGWNLVGVLVMATDGWNASSKQLPGPLPFVVEIRDANLRLLYHFEDVQFPYFTDDSGIRMANIEVPAMAMNGTFFVSFYGYRSLGLATEQQNATGNSYYFDKKTGTIYQGVLPLSDNQTLPVNWIIRVAGL